MFIIDDNTSPLQRQATTHVITLPVLQHEVTPITANKVQRNHQQIKTATSEGILFSVRGMFAYQLRQFDA